MAEISKDIKANNRNRPGKKSLTLMDTLPKNEGEHLELQIHMTKKVTTKSSMDQFLVEQLARLEARLSEWKKSNPA